MSSDETQWAAVAVYQIGYIEGPGSPIVMPHLYLRQYIT